MAFIGVDGCRAGWFSVCLDNRPWKMDLHKTIEHLAEDYRNAALILIDIPIGLPSHLKRRCDTEARRLLSPLRHNSVFSAPSREAVSARDYRSACSINREKMGVGLSQQAWNLCPKIREVDELLRARRDLAGLFRESHPEVCFRGLDGRHPMRHPKRQRAGRSERLNLLRTLYPQAKDVYEAALAKFKRKEVARDDILDALALAVTGLISKGRVSCIPKTKQTDAFGLPMEICFFPSKEGLSQ